MCWKNMVNIVKNNESKAVKCLPAFKHLGYLVSTFSIILESKRA